MTPPSTVADIAQAVRAGQISARAVAQDALDRIAARDGAIGAVTMLLAERALSAADAVDAAMARGDDPGPLAGVPIGVKALFDVAGHPTTAGAAMRVDAAPAVQDAVLLRRLVEAGAVPVAVLNMDEYAYGFVTVNAHFGTTRNPRDTARLAGGSSGGSAAAVAAAMLPLTWELGMAWSYPGAPRVLTLLLLQGACRYYADLLPGPALSMQAIQQYLLAST